VSLKRIENLASNGFTCGVFLRVRRVFAGLVVAVAVMAIDAIRSALLVYRVRGVKPIETALKQVAGDRAFEQTRLEAENATASAATKGILARTSAFIEKTAKVADNLDKIRKAGEGAYSLVARVEPVFTVGECATKQWVKMWVAIRFKSNPMINNGFSICFWRDSRYSSTNLLRY